MEIVDFRLLIENQKSTISNLKSKVDPALAVSQDGEGDHDSEQAHFRQAADGSVF
jgi:hypothetical protein